MSLGKMNQFVPQLILGSALDSSSGPPAYKPAWGTHKTWQFGAHYFFETNNLKNNESTAYAAYGKLYNTTAGEVLFTSFTADDGPHGTLFFAPFFSSSPSSSSSIRFALYLSLSFYLGGIKTFPELACVRAWYPDTLVLHQTITTPHHCYARTQMHAPKRSAVESGDGRGW